MEEEDCQQASEATVKEMEHHRGAVEAIVEGTAMVEAALAAEADLEVVVAALVGVNPNQAKTSVNHSGTCLSCSHS